MRKWVLFAVILASLTGCQTKEVTKMPTTSTITQTTEVKNEKTSQTLISIVVDDHSLSEKRVDFQTGMSVLDVLQNNYQIEEKDGFVTAIDGVTQDEKAGKYWLYYVNGKTASVGAAEYQLKDGDQIKWCLEAMP